MMRTQAILLIRDAILFLSALPADGESHMSISPVDSIRGLTLLSPGVKLGFWRQSCDRIVAPLEVFSQKLLGNVKRFREHGGTNAADVISSSCIACLAHRAVLYEVFSRTDPVAGGMYSFCDSALQSLGMLTSELFLEEYTHFDLLLGVRPWSYRLQMTVAQLETGIGLLEEITVSFRCPHRRSPPRGERVPTTFPEGCWRKVFRFPNQTSRSPAAVDVRFSPAGGRTSEPDVARGEDGVWAIIQVCRAMLACVSVHVLCITYYAFVAG